LYVIIKLVLDYSEVELKNKIGVIGSINTDLISTTSILPKMGETVIGNDFMITYGGKGANVAVAASRLGSSVNMFGCVGDDSFSKDALANLLNEGVHIRSVKQFKNTMCGVASIIVHNGNNQIISILGANGKLDKSYVTKCENVIKECSIIGCQFCVDVEALLVASRIAKENNIKFVLNPSPIKKYDKELFDNATYVIVNEIEVETIKGYNKLNPDEVLTLYPNKLIVTKGDKGASFFNGKEIVEIEN